MNQKLANLRLNCESFKKGNENSFIVRTEASTVLKEAKEKANEQIINEVEDVPMDLLQSIQENKCTCIRSCC